MGNLRFLGDTERGSVQVGTRDDGDHFDLRAGRSRADFVMAEQRYSPGIEHLGVEGFQVSSTRRFVGS